MKDPKKMTIRELRAALENLRRGNKKEKRQPYEGQDVLFAKALNLNGLLRPEDVASEVEDFESFYQIFIRDAKEVVAEYPEEIGIPEVAYA